MHTRNLWPNRRPPGFASVLPPLKEVYFVFLLLNSIIFCICVRRSDCHFSLPSPPVPQQLGLSLPESTSRNPQVPLFFSAFSRYLLRPWIHSSGCFPASPFSPLPFHIPPPVIFDLVRSLSPYRAPFVLTSPPPQRPHTAVLSSNLL